MEKETKNTIRYQEDKIDGKNIIIGPLYIQKSALGSSPPEQVSITLTINSTSN